MKKILVTGFDPFGGATINPAYEAVKLLPDTIKDCEIIKLEVPTVFGKGPQKTVDAIKEYQPDYVLCIGQAGGRSHLTPEFVGINYVQARIPDNEGNQPMNQPLIEGAPQAYFATLPVHAMVKKMNDNGIPAVVSFTAGTYVCNAMLYCVMHAIYTEYPQIKGGFMHVPYAIEQVTGMPEGTPSMNLQDIAHGIELSIEAILENQEDIQTVGGQTH